MIYHIVEKFSELSANGQTKPSKVVALMNNPLADLFIRQTLEKSKFTKHSLHQTFPLYSINFYNELGLCWLSVRRRGQGGHGPLKFKASP